MNQALAVELLNQVGYSFVKFMISSYWQVSIVLTAALLLLLVSGSLNPRIRKSILVAALVLSILLPIVSPFIRQVKIPTASIAVLPVYEIRRINGIVIANDSVSETPYAEAEPSRHFLSSLTEETPYALAGMLYVSIFLILLIPALMIRILLFSRVRKGAVVNDSKILAPFREAAGILRIRRRLKIVTSPDVEAPFTKGLLNPVIFLPDDIVEDLNEDHLRNIAFHEVMHVRNLDSPLMLLATIFRAVFFLNPLVWILVNRIVLLSENICDQFVLSNGSSPVKYAKMLTEIAERLPLRSYQMNLIPGIKLVRSTFMNRVISILNSERFPVRKPAVVTVIAMFMFVLLSFGAALSFPLTNKMLASHSIDFTSVLGNQVLTGLVEASDDVDGMTASKSAPVFILPLKTGKEIRISSGFGDRKNPYNNKVEFHEGIDILAEKGDAVLASTDGVVKRAKFDENRGYHVYLSHEGEYETRYTHLKGYSVAVGDIVTAGQKIGEVGVSGKSTGPHLHFAIMHDDEPMNPEIFVTKMRKAGTKSEDDDYVIIKKRSKDARKDKTVTLRINDDKLDFYIPDLNDTTNSEDSGEGLTLLIQSMLEFPEEAKTAQIDSGKVMLELFVTKSGGLEDVTVISEEPTGYGFGEAARKSLKDLNILLKSDEDEPDKAKMRVVVQFRLE